MAKTTYKIKNQRGTSAPKSNKSNKKLEDEILQSLIQLQKVHLSMVEKFGALSEQISSLLALFEMAARSFSKQPSIQVSEKDKEFLEKIDRLLEQNKTIAKGLTLMEQKMRERLYGPIFPTDRSQGQRSQ